MGRIVVSLHHTHAPRQRSNASIQLAPQQLEARMDGHFAFVAIVITFVQFAKLPLASSFHHQSGCIAEKVEALDQ